MRGGIIRKKTWGRTWRHIVEICVVVVVWVRADSGSFLVERRWALLGTI
jgi:hypothetical protein